jgi:hypothetical protein
MTRNVKNFKGKRGWIDRMIDFLLGQDGHPTYMAFSAAGLDRGLSARRKDADARDR